MTPAERARQIDREEFAAECAAIRQRAYAMLGSNLARGVNLDRWITRKEPKGSIKRPFRKKDKTAPSSSRVRAAGAKLYVAFGHTRTLREWAEATGISRYTIRNRLEIGWTVEDAVSRAVQEHRRPGVVSDFSPSKGTGAGSTAQETPNITFSGNDA